MTAPIKSAALVAVESLVAAVALKLSAAADHVENDAEVIADDAHGNNNADRMNFAVGALLPLEKLTEDLQAILAAARALQGVRS